MLPKHKNHIYSFLLIVFIMTLTITGCTNSRDIPSKLSEQPNVQIGKNDKLALSKREDYEQYLQLGLAQSNTPVDLLRKNAVREAALSFGSQAGFQATVHHITKTLEKYSNSLSVVFDFDELIIPMNYRGGYVIPPVITSANNAVQLNQTQDTLATTEHYFTIKKPGKLSTTIPSWREYLLIPMSKVDLISSGLIPSKKVEQEYFTLWYQKGWGSGTNQALRELELRFEQLKDDYIGMRNYHKMVKLGVINQLVLAQADFGTTTKLNTLRVNNQLLKIVSYSSFQADPRYWNVPHHTSYQSIGIDQSKEK